MDSSNSDPAHLLVVDDDRPMQRLLADALTQQGFAVTVEQDGEWALKTFGSKDLDAVVLDVQLPSLNGYEVARRIRASERGARIPIVFISGVYKNAQQRKEAIERFGAVDFLEKPFKLSALYEALRQALGDRYPRPPPTQGTGESGDAAVDALADGQAQEEQRLVENAARSITSAASIRGEFRTRPFPEVLAEIHRWKGTGTLLLRREKVKKIVYFREGDPLLVKSNLLSECLGRVMVKERMISEAACEESLRRMKASKRQQGTVLIEMGCISPANLSYALNLQLRAKLFEVFTWTTGEFQFNQRADLPAEPVSLEMSTALLIYEGVRRAYDEKRLATALGQVDNLYVHPSDDPLYALQDVGLGEEEHWLLEAADGRKTVADLRALELLPLLDTGRLLYAMKCAQVIELRSSPASGRSATTLIDLPAAGARPPPLPPPPKPGDFAARPALPPPAPDFGGAALTLEVPTVVLRPPPLPAVAEAELDAEVTDPGGPSLDERTLREQLAARVAEMQELDFFQILGVPSTTTDPEILRQAWLARAREHHPDRLGSTASAEIRKLAGQLYEMIALAYQTLSDGEARRQYQKDLVAGIRPGVAEEVGSALAAESRFQRGETLLLRRQYAEAYAAFKEAVQLCGDEGDFHAYLGWSRFQMDPTSLEAALEAIESLARAISLNPRSDKGYLFTGYIYKATGRPELAERQFEKAIQANPGCAEALEELSLLERGAKPGGSRR